MNIELFIARRIVSDKTNRKSISQIIVRIAEAGIAISMVVMLLSVAIVTGFKKEIADKVIGFGSHVQITMHDTNASYETSPISSNQKFLPALKELPEVSGVQTYAIKAGIIKTEKDIQGVVLKGISQGYDLSFFEKYLVAGSTFDVNDSVTSKNVLISEFMADLLNLKVGEKMVMYFIQKPPRVRTFRIAGIYNTGLEIYDQMIALCDIKHVQKLNNWEKDQVTGFEVLINDFENLDNVTDLIRDTVGYGFLEDGSKLYVSNIKQDKPEIFTWLDLTDVNVVVILVLMLIVAGVNMISALLILILERTQMIGITKALGMTNASVRKVFLFNAAFLTARGLFWGNIIGIGLALLQANFNIIELDPSSYYVNTVPINLKLWHLAALNSGTLIVVIAMLVLPSMVVSKISPVRAIRFE